MIRVLVSGARGRMGSITVEALQRADDLELCGAIDIEDDLAAAIGDTRAEVVVDFTTPQAVLDNARATLEAGARPVIGTTGLSREGCDELCARCRELRRGAVLAPNFSIGAVLLLRFSREAARHLPAAEIVEAHHPGKRDAPSGTALATAAAMGEMIGFRPDGSEGATPAPSRGLDVAGVPVHSIRLPGLIAEQQVLFGAAGQTLSLRHVTYDREAFMPGVLLACRQVVGLDHLVEGLESLLFPGG